ncbi:MAG TPA: C4-type zinc ribbon domain-containing protein [Pyrinomonadaceae bacterium]|nr:C4-type zinc ribbon domain-containing protein [Pyrinomonadaceae bacterium]
MKSELEKLIELQKTDTNIRKLKKTIDGAEQKRAGIEQEFERHASSIREIQARRDKTQTERAALEKQISETKTYIERADRNLKNAQNQKEYETAMRETDALQKQVAAFETQTLEKMTEIEEVEKVLAERNDEINSLEANRDAALAEFDKEIGKDRKEFESATKKRNEVFVTLPAQMASIYNRLAQRSRDGIAVAEVIKGSCSACFMKLRPQVQVELKTSDRIITCESCTRILYINSAPETKAASQDS